MQKNNKWSSLLLAMWLVMITSLLAFAILEYIIPFSREIKWIENSSNAYYQANSWIEEALYKVYIRNNSWTLEDTTEYYSESDFSWNKGTKYFTSSSWKTLPPPWEWNSKYDIDRNWNTISQWNPIQLSIWNWMIDSDFEIAFRVPDLNRDWSSINAETLSWTSTPIINWQLSSASDTLNASWSIIKGGKILSSDKLFTDNNFFIWESDWALLDWSDSSFNNFYTNNCSNSWSWCILKFSVVNKIELDHDNIAIPYLEWLLKLDSGNFMDIPLRYTKITSFWKSYWYKKELEIKIPWQTVNEAFDFTVFQ